VWVLYIRALQQIRFIKKEKYRMEKRHKSLLSNRNQEQTVKPPAAKPLRSRWIPDDDPTPRVNVNYRKVPRQFMKMVSY